MSEIVIIDGPDIPDDELPPVDRAMMAASKEKILQELDRRPCARSDVFMGCARGVIGRAGGG